MQKHKNLKTDMLLEYDKINLCVSVLLIIFNSHDFIDTGQWTISPILISSRINFTRENPW